jgi:hypothetical protein
MGGNRVPKKLLKYKPTGIRNVEDQEVHVRTNFELLNLGQA